MAHCACNRYLIEVVEACLACNKYWRGCSLLCLQWVSKGFAACCACNRYWRGLRTAMFEAGFGDGWVLLCLQQVLEEIQGPVVFKQVMKGVGVCCSCKRYWRWLWPAVLAHILGGGYRDCCSCNRCWRKLRTSVAVTDI